LLSGTEPIRVVLANQHPMIRSNLRLLLERELALKVTGEAADGREAAALAEYRRPDIVLLDIKLPPVNGISAAREIASKQQGLGIIFLTVLADEEYVSEAFKAGARGYVLGDVAPTDLFRAIHVVAAGGSFLSPVISKKLIEDNLTESPDGCPLSEHQKELCCLLAAGYPEHEILLRLKSISGAVSGDCQNVTEIVQRVSLPAVIVDSIRGNHHLVKNS
jgi:DNA-binding NarL/FixJ family response regulator